MPPARTSILAHHLLWTLYGHWLANDPRGSGSELLTQEKFASLGPVHQGRKPEHLQPSRPELREFYQQANPLLAERKFWLSDAKRQVLGDAIGEAVVAENYTVWACAVLSNHVHLVIRRHRDDALTMWQKIADATRLRLREFNDIASEHPVWANRPYKVYLYTPGDIRTRVRYVEKNPEKEGLVVQRHDFVQAYNGWPLHKPR